MLTAKQAAAKAKKIQKIAEKKKAMETKKATREHKRRGLQYRKSALKELEEEIGKRAAAGKQTAWVRGSFDDEDIVFICAKLEPMGYKITWEGCSERFDSEWGNYVTDMGHVTASW